MFIFGYPIIFSISVPSMIYVILADISPAVIVDSMVIGFEKKFVLLAVPLFILSAKIMNEGMITERLFNFANKMVGSLKGGLGHVNVLASVIFSGMTGSAIADASGLGLIEIKSMNDAGFDPEFSCAVTSASATIGGSFFGSLVYRGNYTRSFLRVGYDGVYCLHFPQTELPYR
jgi:TRAP-type mannitol/chloroaromatic compound transport system permease large subunit